MRVSRLVFVVLIAMTSTLVATRRLILILVLVARSSRTLGLVSRWRVLPVLLLGRSFEQSSRHTLNSSQQSTFRRISFHRMIRWHKNREWRLLHFGIESRVIQCLHQFGVLFVVGVCAQMLCEQ